MKKTYQTYHAEHGSKYGKSRVCDVCFISHGKKNDPAVKLPLKPTDLKHYFMWKILLDSMIQFFQKNYQVWMDLFGCWKDNQLSELISLN